MSQTENGLTEKQRVILEAYDDDSNRSYQEVAEHASEKLPGDETVSGYYAGQQIKKHRPDGEEPEPEETADLNLDESRVDELVEEYNVSEEKASIMARAEIETEIDLGVPQDIPSNIDVEMPEYEWLRIIGMLQTFSNSDEGEIFREEVNRVTAQIASQAI